MKKGNMTTLASVFVIALVALGVGMGTMAYFSDTVEATGNTFTAGTLDIKLSATQGGTYTNGPLTGIWSTPTNWAPGETKDGIVYFKNDGTIPVMLGLVDMYGSGTGGAFTVAELAFMDWIEVIELETMYDGAVNHVTAIPMWVPWGDGYAPLTLSELADTPDEVGGVDDCDYILYATTPASPNDACLETHAGSKALMDGVYLAPNGGIGSLRMKFKFSNGAPNTYQGESCSFNLKLTFIQGPVSGLCRHELPGFHP